MIIWIFITLSLFFKVAIIDALWVLSLFLFLGLGILQLINLGTAIGFLIVEKEPKKKGIYVFFVLANIIVPLVLFFLPLNRLQERMDFATKKRKTRIICSKLVRRQGSAISRI